mmetsp:Transcript_3996/g.4421  ORF Transcript_3996/g.4421 Transcript_3996/m.4421 type:complete len:219 (-) Transcript_3996:224-880(-)
MEARTYTRNPEHLAFKEQILREAEEILNTGSYTTKKEKKGFAHIVRNEEFEGHRLLGSEGTMDLSWEAFLSAFTNPEFFHEMTKHTGKKVVETSIIEWVDETCYIGYQLVNPPFPLSKRSFVFLATWEDLGDGKHIVNAKSLSHDKKPENSKDVRAVLPATVYMIEERGEQIYVKFSGTFDLKGSIPSAIKKMVETDNYSRLEVFNEVHPILKKRGIV